MKIGVLSPHRDDAAFSLSLAIEAWLTAGHAVHVLNCFTRSEYAPYSDAVSVHPNDLMGYVSALRRREDEAWGRQLGAGLTRTDLNLKDAPLRLHCGVNEVCAVPVRAGDKAFVKIAAALERLGADTLVLPLALGGHVDHRTAREAALPGMRTGVPCAFYEDLPYAARPGAAAEIVGAAERLQADLRPVYVHAEREGETAVARKRRLALAYDSQINDEVTEEIAAFCLRYGGRERLWANAAWRASRLICEEAVGR